MQITKQEAWTDRDHPIEIEIPDYIHSLVEQIAFVARGSELVDQSSGVSARLTIAAMELLQSNMERRAALTHDRSAFPRLSDLAMLLPAITGKVEMVYEGEQQGAEVVARKLIGEAVAKLFATKFPAVERAGTGGRNERNRSYTDLGNEELDDAFASHRGRKQKPPPRQEEKPAAPSEPNYDLILAWFVEGHKITLSDEQPFAAYFAELKRVPKLQETVQ